MSIKHSLTTLVVLDMYMGYLQTDALANREDPGKMVHNAELILYMLNTVRSFCPHGSEMG